MDIQKQNSRNQESSLGPGVVDEYLTVSDVCKLLGIARTTLYSLMANHPDLVTFRVGRKRMMRRSRLDAWVAKQEEPHGSR